MEKTVVREPNVRRRKKISGWCTVFVYILQIFRIGRQLYWDDGQTLFCVFHIIMYIVSYLWRPKPKYF